MAILFMDGFDLYDSVADAVASAKWGATGSPLFSTTLGRSGGGALRLTASTQNWAFQMPSPHEYNVSRVYAFSILWTTLPSSEGSFLVWTSNNTPSGSFTLRSRISAAGEIILWDGNSVPFKTSYFLSAGTWYRLEYKVTPGPTGGSSNGSVEVYVNGNLVASFLDNMYISWNSSTVYPIVDGNFFGIGSMLVDDFTISDDIMGDVIIDTVRPVGNGVAQDWVANTGTTSGAIDDPNGASDGDTTYISSSVSGDKSEFTLGDLSGSSAAILAVQPRVKLKKTDAGPRPYRAYLLSAAAVANGSIVDAPTAYGWSLGDIIELNPDGSVDWTDSAVNALEVGLEATA